MSVASTYHFVVVFGPERVVKTVAVATAFRGQMGVVNATISAGDSSDRIVQKALGAVANVSWPFSFLEDSCPRVIFWYQLMFRHYPLVILNIRERFRNESHANIAYAARTLSSKYKLLVLVDGSNNDLPNELFRNKRGHFVDVYEMDQEIVESFSEFKIFIAQLREADLADVVYHMIGGVPADYEWLRDSNVGLSGGKLIEGVNQFLDDLQVEAINLKLSALHWHPAMSQFYDLFKTEKAVSVSEIHAELSKITRP